jgi:hypothetical protein
LSTEHATIRTQAAEELAAKLQLPPAGLPVLRELTDDQAALLSDLIDAARARRRAVLDSALSRVLRSPRASRLVLRALRRRAA